MLYHKQVVRSGVRNFDRTTAQPHNLTLAQSKGRQPQLLPSYLYKIQGKRVKPHRLRAIICLCKGSDYES